MTLTPLDLSIRFFLQLVVILAACQATGWVFRRIGQSQVVSEMIAGVLLGPSLLGWLFPSAAGIAGPFAASSRLSPGAFMNARGLMELIILNIGLERGIIEPTLFTLMVLMAVVTTLAATPLFERVYGRRALRPDGALPAG